MIRVAVAHSAASGICKLGGGDHVCFFTRFLGFIVRGVRGIRLSSYAALVRYKNPKTIHYCYKTIVKPLVFSVLLSQSRPKRAPHLEME